jgi:hypothetical protein
MELHAICLSVWISVLAFSLVSASDTVIAFQPTMPPRPSLYFSGIQVKRIGVQQMVQQRAKYRTYAYMYMNQSRERKPNPFII